MMPRAKITRHRSRNNKSARKIATTYFCVIKCVDRRERRNFSRYSRHSRVGTAFSNYHSLIEPPGADPCQGPDIFAAPFALIGVNYSFVFACAHLPGLDPALTNVRIAAIVERARIHEANCTNFANAFNAHFRGGNTFTQSRPV